MQSCVTQPYCTHPCPAVSPRTKPQITSDRFSLPAEKEDFLCNPITGKKKRSHPRLRNYGQVKREGEKRNMESRSRNSIKCCSSSHQALKRDLNMFSGTWRGWRGLHRWKHHVKSRASGDRTSLCVSRRMRCLVFEGRQRRTLHILRAVWLLLLAAAPPTGD